jgi:hypothetical protein
MLCILIRCTDDKNIEIIQPLIQELQHFFVFPVLAPWWPSQESEGYTCAKFQVNTPGCYKM